MSTLYEELGGQAAVDYAVDIFYHKVLEDDRIKHFFQGVDMEKQRGMMRIFLGFAFGGPVNYSGKSMRAAHMHMNITDEHFDAVVEHLGETLKELNVAQELIAKVAAIAESTRNDVLNHDPAPTPAK